MMFPHHSWWLGFLIGIAPILLGLAVFVLFITLTGDVSRPRLTTFQKVIGWAFLAALLVPSAYVTKYGSEVASLKLCLWLLPTSWCIYLGY
jgi:hypothetical protein